MRRLCITMTVVPIMLMMKDALAESLKKMKKCHAAYFCKGWEKARGCMLEHAAAVDYGLKIISMRKNNKT